MTLKDYKVISPFLLFYLALTFFVSGNSFFWDTIQLGSSQAHWFYDNDFKYLFLSKNIDSGHPPLFGFYLALLWKFFGRTIQVNHFAMLPFLLGIIIQLYILLRKFFEEKYILFLLLLLLADPTLLSQSILVSPDIILVFFFLLSLNSLLQNKKMLLVISLIFLAMISMRGMMHVAIIFLFSIFNIYLEEGKISSKRLSILLCYIPAGFIAGLWLYLHFLHTGWVGYHDDSPWSGCFQPVDTKGLIRNIFIFGWRMLDFGRIIIWILAVPVLYFSAKRSVLDKNSKKMLGLFLISIMVLVPTMLLRTNLLAPRYLIVIYLSFALLIFYQLQLLKPDLIKKLSLCVVFVLLCGNLLVYPEGIAQGWDSSLAHYPYYKLRKEMMEFIKSEKIPYNEIGTAFPNNVDIRHIDLADSSYGFANKDLKKNKYVFYSNVFNDFTDEEIKELKKWPVIKRIKSLTVEVVLYKNSAEE
jgi:hypothetical protein